MGKVKKDKTSKPVAEVKTKPQSPKKKKSADKRASDDLNSKYGMILPQSIKCMAESIGIASISDEIANNLSEDVSYRLRSIVQLCGKYLKHTRHRRLRCDDVNTVLGMCDAPPVFGSYSFNQSTEFTPIDDSNIFVLDDVEIDLCNYVLEETVVGRKPPTLLTGQWLAADDVTKAKPADEVDSIRICNSEARREAPESPKTTEPVQNVSPNVIKYFMLASNFILGRSDLKILTRDLARSEKIMEIVPFLLNFIAKTLTDFESERMILRLLATAGALTINNRIDFRPYRGVTYLGLALLKIIKDHPSEGTGSGNYSSAVRIKAAQVLARVNQKWCHYHLDKDLVSEMLALLANVMLPASIHVAAISLLCYLPSHALRKYLQSFLTHTQTNQQEGPEMRFAVMEAAQRLYRNASEPQESDCPSVMEIDQLLYEYFGDAICPSRLHLLENPRFINKYLVSTESEKHETSVDSIPAKGTLRLPKCLNSMYNPDAKRATIHTAFELPVLTKKRNARIFFKFVGANPVPEMSLKRRRLDSRYSQFIAGKATEGHVILVGKFWRERKLSTSPSTFQSASLFSVL